MEKLKGEWCDMAVCSEMDDTEDEDIVYSENNQCRCGVDKHHYHRKKCGHIIQVG
tara:strand:- start:672 stop:836 length:165 start_codon:yes stop_codon:yes gene_type:complete